MAGSASAWLGKKCIDGRMGKALGPLTDMVLGRPFPANSRLRVQIYYQRSRISFSQVFPFLHYAQELRVRYGAEIRFFEVERLLDGQLSPVGADIVMVQPWFSVGREALARALERVRGANPQARIIFLDSYAHNDLRLARTVDPFIDLYLKKSLFRDRERYFSPTQGDTNLTDYYAGQHGFAEEKVDWRVPRSILPKLVPGANFFTAPGLMESFLGAPPDLTTDRPVDVHARLTADGTGWYAGMRRESLARIGALGRSTLTGTGIGHTQFMEELGRSKLVFSPFGYGELCWRDVEGFATGAVVVKQDMGHLETRPDLYRPWETYVPVAWDFSDLEANVARALRDKTLRQRIAETAWQVTHDYLTGGEMIRDLAPLLSEKRRAPTPSATPQRASAARRLQG